VVRQVRLSIYEHTHLLLIGFSIARPLMLPRGQHLVTLTPKREQQSAGTPQIDRECDDQADQEAKIRPDRNLSILRRNIVRSLRQQENTDAQADAFQGQTHKSGLTAWQQPEQSEES
jgi:hypothetical protein